MMLRRLKQAQPEHGTFRACGDSGLDGRAPGAAVAGISGGTRTIYPRNRHAATVDTGRAARICWKFRREPGERVPG